MRATLALYGNIKIPRSYCQECQSWAFVMDNARQCCGARIEDVEIQRCKRMSHPDVVRKYPKKKDRERLLEEFQNACAYCDRTFNRFVRYHGQLKRTRLTWDHQTPWVFSQDNRGANFLPACQFCNGWKSSLIFKTIEDVKIYVAVKWEEDLVAYPRQIETLEPSQ